MTYVYNASKQAISVREEMLYENGSENVKEKNSIYKIENFKCDENYDTYAGYVANKCRREKNLIKRLKSNS